MQICYGTTKGAKTLHATVVQLPASCQAQLRTLYWPRAFFQFPGELKARPEERPDCVNVDSKCILAVRTRSNQVKDLEKLDLLAAATGACCVVLLIGDLPCQLVFQNRQQEAES